jgi:hypothetical protein
MATTDASCRPENIGKDDPVIYYRTGSYPRERNEHTTYYGLRGMRERTKLMGGKLAVWSELDSGSELELSIPASRAYETSVRRRSWLVKKLAGKDTEAKS